MRILMLVMIAALLQNIAQAEQRTIIKAGRMLDTVSGKVLRDQTIVIAGDRIVSVGKLRLDPTGARVIDLSDYTVLPGLIDMHVHLTGDHRYHGYKRLELSVPRQTLHGAMNAAITLQAGFTSARNVGAGAYADVALRDAINAGELPGPRLRVSGPALGITGGHCDNNLLPPSYDHRAEGVADGPWAVRAKVRENIKYGVDLIKYCATGGVLSKGDSVGGPQYTLEEMQAIVDEAHMHGRRVAAHAHGAEGIRRAIVAGVDSIEHASLIDAEGIALAKKHGTYLVMDVYNDTYILENGAKVGMLPESLEKERQIGQLQRDNFKKAFQSGARMAFGSDAAVYPHGHNGKQFAYMVQYGMTPMQAVQAATIHAAELIGWPDDVGAIENGRYADIVAIKGDPLADVALFEDIAFVMKGGEIYKSDKGAGPTAVP